jgi:transposase
MGSMRPEEIKRKLRRSELIPFFEKLETCTVVLEACGAGHHWARILSSLGHEVKLIAPEAVRPFVKKGQEERPGRCGSTVHSRIAA